MGINKGFSSTVISPLGGFVTGPRNLTFNSTLRSSESLQRGGKKSQKKTVLQLRLKTALL